jgi:hypothetical protein
MTRTMPPLAEVGAADSAATPVGKVQLMTALASVVPAQVNTRVAGRGGRAHSATLDCPPWRPVGRSDSPREDAARMRNVTEGTGRAIHRPKPADPSAAAPLTTPIAQLRMVAGIGRIQPRKWRRRI